ncbi:MAG: glycerol-3-phosphate 1-O-acyltransferase [Sphingobacteriia bacterium]|nr:glycerol-3-phosphate 1-O-acyltransferase [Sphingobacteriia bacterium]
MTNDIWYITAAVLVAYLLGSIPSAVWIGKVFWGIDVRNEGSGNAGATNTLRVLGLKAGIPVLLFDVFKGWLAVYLLQFLPIAHYSGFQTDLIRIVLAVAVVIGHVFPLFAGFRGGKGIATLLGVGIALYPVAVIVTVGIFIFFLVITRYVSLSSIISSVLFPIMVILFFNPHSTPLILLAIFVGIFVPLTHRKNIYRLLHNQESKFSIKKKSK